MNFIYEVNDLCTLEYEQIESLIPSQIPHLRAISSEKNNVIIPNNCNDFLTRCLRMKDGNVDKAIRLVKSFKSAIASFPTWKAVFRPSAHELVYKNGYIVLLPGRGPKGRYILFCRAGSWNPEKWTEAQRQGFVAIFDDSKFTMKHTWAIKKLRLLEIANILQDGVGGRVKEYHGVNHPRIVGIIYAAVKPFLKEKLKRRIFFHDSHETLVSRMDKRILPVSVGGTLFPDKYIDTDLLKKLLAQDNYFTNMVKDGFPSK